MSASAHVRYRAALERLASDDVLGLEAGWERRTARFFPDQEPFAVLTLERAGRMLRADVFAGLRVVTADAADDPALPGLRAVLDGGAEIVRYHPGLRCTVRAGDRFGKVLSDGSGPALLDAQRRLWAARAELGFAVAEPLAYDEATRTVWQRAVPGERAPLALAGRMGAALATLARSSVRPAARAEDRAPAAARELVRRVPVLRREVAALLDDIEPGPPRPVHGAPHPPQWLAGADMLGLIDFDRLALGDPEADVAAFVEAAAAEDGGEPAAEAFAAGYDGPLDARRLGAYRRRRRIAKALRAASSLRPDGASGRRAGCGDPRPARRR
ncbi:MAG TPA: phosphotransferase, partial [Solirubrobacter sp.]|nr:phosphotransferase [Solirubrobacter sp.]